MKAKIRVCTIIFLGIFLGSWHTNAQEPISTKTSQTQTDSSTNNRIDSTVDDDMIGEQEPDVDLNRLSSLVVYPEDARAAGVEGKVVLRVLINKDGSLRKYMVDYSDSEMLIQAAKDAVKKYGKFRTAIQNGKPIDCWLSIPIHFKLNNAKKSRSVDN